MYRDVYGAVRLGVSPSNPLSRPRHQSSSGEGVIQASWVQSEECAHLSAPRCGFSRCDRVGVVVACMRGKFGWSVEGAASHIAPPHHINWKRRSSGELGTIRGVCPVCLHLAV